ncbi:GNAT family N-acetyltransferase [Silanimonas sp.]|jgi:putative acetyltransferase|uniref:GNAT family N-acetyltransferase n=1 Tax=Silanimonas sp. TaxID=1929290 RepID=UPI0037C62F95
MSLVVRQATTDADLAMVRELFVAYREHLGIDLGFQQFDAELRDLPGAYAPPRGRLFLAMDEGVPLGCVALRAIDTRRAEMKRLFVRPEGRGRGVGRALIARVLDEARAIGYLEVVLDTLPSMTEAQELYARFGFRDIAPYAATPIAGTRFLALALTSD